jgi:glycosyltransferase involved in cell wall biosynthesis
MNRGGVETVLMNYYISIDRQKVEFDFLLMDNSYHKYDYEDEIINYGGQIYRVPLLSLYNPWKYLHAIDILFKKHREYKIVHSHMSALSVFPLYVAKKNNVLVRIAHSHSTHGGNLWKHCIKSILKLFIKRFATHFFACGSDAATWLYGEDIVRTNRVVIFRNAIHASLYSYSKEERLLFRSEKSWNDNFIVGHIGRFSYPKNHRFVLDVFKHIKLLCPQALLLLVGDGEDRDAIEKKIEFEGLKEAVFLTGVVDNVFDYTQAMDVFLFPSLYEGLGMALVEAQAAGLPCFTSEMVPREAAVTDLVEFISLSRGAEYWASRILRYKDGYVRRNTYNDIRKASYDVQQNAEWLENYYVNMFNSMRKL